MGTPGVSVNGRGGKLWAHAAGVAFQRLSGCVVLQLAAIEYQALGGLAYMS
jgi:hypothetical protein